MKISQLTVAFHGTVCVFLGGNKQKVQILITVTRAVSKKLNKNRTRKKLKSRDQLKGEKRGKTVACVTATDFFPLFEIFVSKSYDRSPAPHIHSWESQLVKHT